MRHQQKRSRQTLFAGIEKLINQILLITDVSLQKILYKHGRQFGFQTHGEHHRLFLDVQKNAICHGSRGSHTQKLTSKTTFPEEIAFPQNTESRFLPGFRYDTELHLPRLDKK